MKLTVVVVSFLFTISSLYAINDVNLFVEPRAADMRAAKIITPYSTLPVGEVSFGRHNRQYEYDHWELGSTWYDYQHNASQGKQIVVGDDGVVHFAWMKAFAAGANVRHVVYTCYDDPIPGNSVDNSQRSGYCTIDVLGSDAVYANAAVVGFHQQPNTDFITALSPDYGPCWQAFHPLNHPIVEEWWDDDQPMWPHIAVDVANIVHVLATRPVANDHYYDAAGDSCNWVTPGWQDLPSFNNGISAVPVTSEFDTRVALLTHDHLPIHPQQGRPMILSQGLNDVWAYLSEDGSFSDSSYVNITELLEEENTGHPLPGTIYAYCDLDGVFDTSGNLHVVYTTFPYWWESTLIDGEEADDMLFYRWSKDGQIWHALIDMDGDVLEFSHIAGYVGSNNEDPSEWAHYFESRPGEWGSTIDRPSLSIDPENGYLYCMYRSFGNQADTSATGYSNADLFITASCDNGSSWGQAINITDTTTPGCEPGNCESEAWGTLAEVVHEGMLHLEFVCDLDAGAIPQEEGSWTDNPVYYMQVPVDEVPCDEAWDIAPRTTQLTSKFWAWELLEDGTYEIQDYMRLLNESRSTVIIYSIEVYYNGTAPDVELLGEVAGEIEPYDYHEYSYLWNAVIGDDQHDAVIRFNTNGGTCDFTLSNRNEIDWDTAESFLLWGEAVSEPETVAESIHLHQNHPNPFNPTTTIEFTLPYPQRIELAVYNLLGERLDLLAQGSFEAGMHQVEFNGAGLPSGVYFYRLTAGNQMLTRKMVLVK